MNDEKRNCKKHGYTLFKYKKSKKDGWYLCHKCLKLQWKKAQNKQRKKVGYKEYHDNYGKDLNKIRKSLSVYLAMILFATNIKPE